ncbi:MAG TPA: MliC family protein [Devosia sp.]|nr:MliC family protein [Devosia sp.]
MRSILSATLSVFLVCPALAAVTADVGLTFSGDADKKTVTYDCESHAPLTVTYINAAPNYVALVPITDDETSQTSEMIFVSVITGSGVRYEAGQYVWWNKGSEAWLYDVMEGADAAPLLTCTENVETP